MDNGCVGGVLAIEQGGAERSGAGEGVEVDRLRAAQ